MRGLRFVLLVVMAIAGLVFGSGVGASAGKGAASPGARLHVRDVVLKGGAHAYVRMPDRIRRLLSTSDTPAFSCLGASSKVNTSTAQTCTWGPNYRGSVTCLQVSNSANVTQTCDVSQSNTAQNNTALIVQVIWSQNPSPDQDGTQIVRLRQTNVTGANNAGISQYIKQSKGPGTPDDTEEGETEPGAPPTLSATQKQESHQTVHLRQITSGLAAGSNNAAVLQFLRQRARSSNAAMVTQSQNTALRGESCVPDATDELGGVVTVDANANQCILSNQTSSNGRLNLILNGDYNQFQRARNATSGSQTQGVPFTGGGDYGLVQASTGLATVLTNQTERQVQRAIDANVAQAQHGPRKGAGSSQTENPNDKWVGFQTSTQIQTSTTTSPTLSAGTPGIQTNFLQYFGTSTGDIRATQTANQNGEQTTNSCPPPGAPAISQNHICAAQIVCRTPGGGDVSTQQTSNCTATTVCPEGTQFNPKTGQCEPIPCEGEGCTISVATVPTPSIRGYSYKR
jgi:hypothetical protein